MAQLMEKREDSGRVVPEGIHRDWRRFLVPKRESLGRIFSKREEEYEDAPSLEGVAPSVKRLGWCRLSAWFPGKIRAKTVPYEIRGPFGVGRKLVRRQRRRRSAEFSGEPSRGFLNPGGFSEVTSLHGIQSCAPYAGYSPKLNRRWRRGRWRWQEEGCDRALQDAGQSTKLGEWRRFSALPR